MVFNAVDKICFRNSENMSRAQIPEHIIVVNLYFVWSTSYLQKDPQVFPYQTSLKHFDLKTINMSVKQILKLLFRLTNWFHGTHNMFDSWNP